MERLTGRTRSPFRPRRNARPNWRRRGGRDGVSGGAGAGEAVRARGGGGLDHAGVGSERAGVHAVVRAASSRGSPRRGSPGTPGSPRTWPEAVPAPHRSDRLLGPLLEARDVLDGPGSLPRRSRPTHQHSLDPTPGQPGSHPTRPPVPPLRATDRSALELRSHARRRRPPRPQSRGPWFTGPGNHAPSPQVP